MPKSKNKKNFMSRFSSSQVYVPPHLWTWPDLKVPMPSGSQRIPKAVKQGFKDNINYEDISRFSAGKQEEKRLNRFNGEDGTRSSSTKTGSNYDSADEEASNSVEEIVNEIRAKSKKKNARSERSRSDLNESSSGADTISEDEESSNSHGADTTKSSEQDLNWLTPLSTKGQPRISSIDKLKSAIIAKQDENKKKGVKPSTKGNVFNAMSPPSTPATPSKPVLADKVSKKEKAPTLSTLPATVPVPRLRIKRSDVPPPPSLLRKFPSQPKDAIANQAPNVTGPNPPPPKWQASSNSASGHDHTTVMSTPQVEKRDRSGYRTFSSSAFTNESSPELEIAEPDAGRRKTKKKKKEAQKTGGDVVLAEARKQGARLQALSRLRKIQFPELSFLAESETSNPEAEDEISESDEQSSDEHWDAGTSSYCDSEKEVEAVKDKERKGKTLDEQKNEPHKVKFKERKPRDGDDVHERSVHFQPQSAPKSKKRKRDSNNYVNAEDAEILAKNTKKAKKTQENDDQIPEVQDDGAEGLIKKKVKRKKKRVSSAPLDPGMAPIEGKSTLTSKQSKDTALASQGADLPTRVRKDGDKKKKSKQNDTPEPGSKSLTSPKISDSATAAHLFLNPTCIKSVPQTHDKTAKHDMNRLMIQLRQLLPLSVLQSALAKLNSEDHSVCSQRKRLSMKNLKKHRDGSGEACNANYTVFDDVTLITAAKDLILLLSGARLGVHLIGYQGTSKSSAGTSQMELELGRIAVERQWEIEELKEQVGSLQCRMQG